MAHDAQRLFFERVKEKNPHFFKRVKVLEVGSLDINGTVRDFFDDTYQYLGIDVGPGPGVDVVVSGDELDYPDNYFDVSVSSECFEHNPVWKETFLNMVRMTVDGGLVMFTCAGLDRPEHGTTRSDVGSSPLTVAKGWEYYRNLEPSDFDGLLDAFDGVYQFFYEPYAKDLYFLGTKGGDAYWKPDTEGTHWIEQTI